MSDLSRDPANTMLAALKAAETGLSESIEFIRRHSGSEFEGWQWLQQNHAQVRAAISSAEKRL
jgi:hypothetical protein